MKRILLTFISLVLLSLSLPVESVLAGTNISVSCSTTTCTVSPSSVPVFNETNIWPGYTVTQQITAQNISDQNGAFGLEISEETPILNFIPNNLANKIFVEIHEGSAAGPLIYGGSSETLQNLYDLGSVALGALSPTQSQVYFFKATFDPLAANEYMNTSTDFDLNIGANFTPVTPPGPGPNPDGGTPGGPGGGGGGGGGPGGTSAASPPVCSDTAPSSAPFLFFTESSTADGQVTLQWSGVSPVSHYAINFGIQPGVYIFGNNNVGNQTSYTVSGLTPGNQYFFQVLGINGCAAGPRSNQVATGGQPLGAGTVVGAPIGFAPDQVLGVETESTGEAAPATESGTTTPDILGAIQECTAWMPYLPLIFLLAQLILSLIIYGIYRDPANRVKQVVVALIVLGCTVAFYFLRNCDCANNTLLRLICQWYFLIALAAAVILQFINYGLIEKEKEE